MAAKSRLVVIVGPTASGKTALAIEIAKAHNGEIICADSRTVYKGMDIGTAKPTQQEQSQVPHHCLDLVTPDQTFTAAQFQQCANVAIDEISSRGKLPVMVGGTGLYVDSVLFDYQFGPAADPIRRAQLEAMTTDELVDYCQKNSMDLPTNSKNKRHLIRAIELGGVNSNRDKHMRDNTIVVGISTPKEILASRVTGRAKDMFNQDIVAETTTLVSKYGLQNEAMTGNIYPIVWRMIQGEITKAEALEQFIKADIGLAKRQRTWFKRNKHIIWSDDTQELKTKVEHFLSNKN